MDTTSSLFTPTVDAIKKRFSIRRSSTRHAAMRSAQPQWIRRGQFPCLAKLVAVSSLLGACGGGGSAPQAPAPPPPPPPPQNGALEFAADSYVADEADGSIAIAVRRSGGSAGVVTADVTPSGGNADAADFDLPGTVVTFADGDTADKTVVVSLTDDADDEPDETIELALSGVSGGATLGARTATVVTILDDDPALVSVGGETSGLAGSGLLLRLDDGQELAIGADGPFAFSLPLVEGTPYAVDVVTQPWEPAQTCTLNNAVGTAGATDVTSLDVSCDVLPLQSLVIKRTSSAPSQAELILVREDGEDETPLAAPADRIAYRDIVNGRLVYERQASGIWDLFSVRLDGTETTALTNTPLRTTFSGATSTGTVLYSSDSDLFAVNVDGTGAIQLTDSADSDVPGIVTADGSVVFTRTSATDSTLYGIDITGDNLTPLAALAGFETPFAATGNGRLLYQVANGGQFDLFSVSLDGTGTVAIADDPVNETFRALLPNDVAVWSRDSGTQTGFDVYATRADGSQAVALAESLSDEFFELALPGERVLYSPVVSGQADLYVVNLDGTGRLPLATGLEREVPVGLTSDERLVYRRDTAPGVVDLYIAELDGSASERVATGSQDAGIGIVSRDGGDYLVFTSAGPQADLFAVDLRDGGVQQLTDTVDAEFFVAATNSGGVIYLDTADNTLRRVGVKDDGRVVYSDPAFDDQLRTFVEAGQ